MLEGPLSSGEGLFGEASHMSVFGQCRHLPVRELWLSRFMQMRLKVEQFVKAIFKADINAVADQKTAV